MKIAPILMFFIIISCNSAHIISKKKKKHKTDCVENEAFKKKFFSSIEYIDHIHNYNYRQLDTLNFESVRVLIEEQNQKYNSALSFIGHYAHVSWEKRLNYDNSYPTDRDYQLDKEGWLRWYEENKCNNIQFKMGKTSKTDCIENEAFKEKFFSSIDNIENFLLNKGKRSSYEISLGFISQYTHVSYEKTLNYDNRFPFTSFQEDKSNWLRWYEENKCNNIQFKTGKTKENGGLQ